MIKNQAKRLQVHSSIAANAPKPTNVQSTYNATPLFTDMFEILAALDVAQLFTGQMSLTDIRKHVMAESR
ncbi:MAG TPA: hypothetical protein VHV10_04135, partial [Ktedonobacteraceae bacterium]|nr:hypothetical protein [Ktedonobacteraceae bacterium]